MRRSWQRGACVAMVLGWAAACASSPADSDEGEAGGSGGGSASGGSGGSLAVDASDSGVTRDSACGVFSAEAKQASAAIMFVLDRSSSMATGGKWAAAQQAIATTIDLPAFDNLALGLLAYPTITTPAPRCLGGFVATVSCGVTQLPQVPLADAGTQKSNQPGSVRNAIYQYVANASPDNTGTDASPGYDAMRTAIQQLARYTLPNGGKRVMVFITDGGFSCASVSSPTRPGWSDGLCPDWEQPPSVIALLEPAHRAGVDTFVVGVPGSNSTGQMQGRFATPPYHMRLALSTYALAGSPNTIPADCDGRIFSATAGDPRKSCHFDMTTGPFDANALGDVLKQIRGAALGCTYELPQGDAGEVDRGTVNVSVAIDGRTVNLKKRRDASDACADGCWDYDANGQVELIGQTCTDLKASDDGKVEILVGCATEVR